MIDSSLIPNEYNPPSPIAEVAESISSSDESPAPPTGTQSATPQSPTSSGGQPLNPQAWATTDARSGSSPTIGHGGLPPPSAPQFNPRRGSCTGSYGLPVPPDWLAYHARTPSGRGPSGGKMATMVTSGSFYGLSGGRSSPRSSPGPKTSKTSSNGPHLIVSGMLFNGTFVSYFDHETSPRAFLESSES